ncbi:MAG: RNA polymerase sigma factor [Oscillospiraceae bacterium]
MIFFMVVDGDFAKEKIHQQKIDETLFVRIGNDDKDALEELYLFTQRAVSALVLSILKDPYATQDIVQDTYLKVRSAAHLYIPQGKPLAWIFTIAKNLAFSYLRQNSKMISNEEMPDNDLRYSCVTDTTDRLVLKTALDILDDSERQIIFLHLISGITHREIAASLALPISTVLSRYHRALKKLKKHLTDKEA